MKTISAIIPTFNYGRFLREAIDSVFAQTYPVIELIVVDDGSTDGTAAIAQSNGARVVPVQFRQIARARNAGAHAAAGSTLIFVDADTIVFAATVRATIEALKNGAAGGGANVDFEGRLPLWVRLILPLFSFLLRVGHLAAGCYVFCSREAFEAIGGFDERLYAAEEIAFSRTLRRQGAVVILRESVLTSGRKLRSHSGWEVLRLIAAVIGLGTSVVRSRKRLSIWYGDRRDDPE